MKILKLIPILMFTSMSLMASTVILYKDESLNKLNNPIQYAQGLNAAIENNSGINEAKNITLTTNNGGGSGNSNSNNNQNNNNVDTTPPTITSLSTFSFDENIISNFQITATDNVSSNFGYVLGGVDSSYFTLDGNGIITFKAKPDFETKPIFNINVIVKDEANNESNQDITININNLIDSSNIVILPNGTITCQNATPGTTEVKDGTTYYIAINSYDAKSHIDYFGGTYIANNICTTHIMDMNGMFLNKTMTFDISNWDVSNVTNMSNMFRGSIFNEDISKWNTLNVLDMSNMFLNSQFNGDISNWDVSNVLSMSGMFRGSLFNKDISNWNVSNVTNMYDMFNASVFNGDISNWDVSNVLDMYGMFNNSQFNGDISSWKVLNVNNMGAMFNGATSFNQDISNWDVISVTNMYGMFNGATSFNQDLSKWCVSNISSLPSYFDSNTTSWIKPNRQPIWGTCPNP